MFFWQALRLFYRSHLGWFFHHEQLKRWFRVYCLSHFDFVVLWNERVCTFGWFLLEVLLCTLGVGWCCMEGMVVGKYLSSLVVRMKIYQQHFICQKDASSSVDVVNVYIIIFPFEQSNSYITYLLSYFKNVLHWHYVLCSFLQFNVQPKIYPFTKVYCVQNFSPYTTIQQ